jgi:putative Holliday junction resolvase
MVLLCLDIGSKRIGVAVSDELGIAAHPLTVIERKGLGKDVDRIVQLCRERGAESVVVGIPLDEEGRIGTSAKKVLGFVDNLKRALEESGVDIDVETWDERYSTAEAEDMLIDADVSRAKRRRIVDKLAAAKILQDYMDHH